MTPATTPGGTYRAQVMTAPERLEWTERPRRALEPTEARVRVRAAGVCGTDLALWGGGYEVPLPLVMGHEFYGEVVEVGAAATDDDRALVGRLVTAEINNTCRALRRTAWCPMCRMNLAEHCTERTVTGIIAHDGAFAEEVVVPLGALHALPSWWGEPLGIFVEPLAAALQTFERRPLRLGERVVVLGLGRLGALIAAVAKEAGAEVLGVARSEATIARAAAFGVRAIAAGDGGAAVRAEVARWTGGLGADLVVEATADPTAIALALDLVRPRGAISVKSTPGRPAPLPLTALVVKEVDLLTSRCGPFRKALGWLRTHPLPLGSLLSHEFPLADLPAALAAAPRGGKVLVRVAS